MSKPSPSSPREQTSIFGSGSSPASSKNSSILSNNSDLSMSENDFQIRLQILQKKHEKEIMALTNDLNRSREENIEKSSKIHEMEKEKDVKLQEQQRINSDLSRKNIQLQTQIDSFLSLINSKTGEDLQTLKDASILFTNVLAESSSNSDSLASVQQVNREMSETLAAFQAKLVELKNENKALKATLKKSSSQTEINAENEKTQNYVKKIEEIQRKAALDSENYQEDLRERDSKIDSLKKQIQSLRDQLQYDQEVQSDNSKQLQETQMVLLQQKLQISNEELNRKQKESQTLQENLNKAESTIAELNSKISSLQDELEEREEIISQASAQTDDLKKKKGMAREALKAYEAELTAARTRIHELELQLSMAEETIKALQNNKGIEDSRKKYVASCDTVATAEAKLLRDTIETFEEVMATQRSEITSLTKQRSELVSSLLTARSALENSISNSEEKTKLIKELQQEITEGNRSTKTTAQKEQEEFANALDGILEIVPAEIVDYIADLHSYSPAETLRKVVEALLSHKEDNQITPEIESLKRRHIAMLGHLKNITEFLRKLSKTSSPNSDERAIILRQCAVVGRYLDEEAYMLPNEEFSRVSLFEPHEINDPESVLKVFYDFVGESEIDETPIRELYTLFCCLIQVNAMMMNSLSELRKIAAESATQKAYIAELNAKVIEQETLIEQFGQQKIKLTPIIKKFIADPPVDFGDLVDVFCEVMKDGPLSTEEGQKLKREIDDLNALIIKERKQFKEKEDKLEAEKQEFCEKANEIANNMDEELHAMADEFNAKIEDLESELEDTKLERDTIIKELEGAKTRHDKELDEKNGEISEFNKRLEEAIAKVKKTQKDLEDAKVDAIKARNEKETFTKTAQSDIQMLTAKLQKETARKNKLRQRLMIAEEQNNGVLSDVQQKTDSLASQYSTSLQFLQAELDSARARCSELEERISKQQPALEDMMKQLSAAKAAEKLASIKCEDAKAALEQERATFAARMKTAQLNANLAVKQSFDECKQNFAKLKEAVSFATKFENSRISDREFCEKAVTMLKEIVMARDSVIARDALALRRSLAMPDSGSLCDLFKQMQNELFIADERAKKAEASATEISSKYEASGRENKRLEKSREELLEWIRWSRSVFRQISDVDVSATATPSDIRFLLEERLLSSFNYNTVCRKLEILRNEKSLLANGKTFLAAKNTPVRSIRPIILASAFARILQGMSCCVPAEFSVPKPEKPKKKSVVPVE